MKDQEKHSVKDNVHIIKDAFGKEHTFDYTKATPFGYEIFSKNARVIIIIEHNDKQTLADINLTGIIEKELNMEWPIVNYYLPFGTGIKVDIYRKKDE